MDKPPEWHEERRTGIGSSDAPAVMGVKAYGKTRVDVFDEKTGRTLMKPPTSAMKRGRYFEPVAVAIWMADTGRQARRQPMRRHRKHHFMISHVDRQIIKGPRGTITLEVKCPGSYMYRKILAEGLPDYYQVQLQHQLEVDDRDLGMFLIFSTESCDYKAFEVERDREMGQLLIEREGEFWDMVKRDERPTDDAPQYLPDLPPVSGEIVRRDDQDWFKAVCDLTDAKRLLDIAKEVDGMARDQIRTLLPGHGIYEGADVRVHFQQQKGKRKFDLDALKATGPLDAISVAVALETVRQDMPAEQFAALTEAMKEARLDFDDFVSVGKPFDRMTPYYLKALRLDEGE